MFEKTSVINLTGADFKDIEPWNLKKKRCSYVLFYAPWCGHCRDFEPIYAKFANMAQFIYVCAVNSDKEQSLLQNIDKKSKKFKVQGFPTLWVYKNGSPVREYNGEKTLDALVKDAKKLCGKCECYKN